MDSLSMELQQLRFAYEVNKDGRNVDPKHYFFKDLTPEQFAQLVARSSNNGQSFD